ncbi:MAG: helix-turn-helix transcriptional regulator [Clostridia bacterium]|nr:helix-turn-helix transcriptional regulator [Clostridia bacterium]
MQFKEINPYIRFFDVRSLSTGYKSELLAYDFRAFVGLAGSFYIALAGMRYRILPNTVLVVPPATPYRLCVEEGAENRFCIFNFDMGCAGSSREQSIPPQPVEEFVAAHVISSEAPDELRAPVFFEMDFRASEWAQEIAELFRSRPPLYREEAGAILKRLLTVGVRRTRDMHSTRPKLLDEIMAYIRLHYADAISNTSIAAAFQYHPNHLNRIFKKHTGMGLHAYIISYRLKMAKELLRNTDYHIDEIAYATGFATPSHFIKHFKCAFGDTPYRFRAGLGE